MSGLMRTREVVTELFFSRFVRTRRDHAEREADEFLTMVAKCGYQLVPIEPSEKMIERAERELGHSSTEKHLDRKKFYKAMLQASLNEEG